MAPLRTPLLQLAALVVLLAPISVRAMPLRVGVPIDQPPCSEGSSSSGGYRGWAYDTWGSIADHLDRDQLLVPLDSLEAGLQGLETNALDVLATCLTNTPGRAARIDLSLPIREDSLRLIQKRSVTPLQVTLAVVSNQVLIGSLMLLVGLSCLTAVLLQVAERNHQAVSPPPTWPQTLQQLLQKTGSMIIGSGIHSLGSRSASILIWTSFGLIRLVIAAFVTASLTTWLINKDEAGPRFQLPSRTARVVSANDRIGVIQNHAAEEILRAAELSTGTQFKHLRRYSNLTALAQAVARDEVRFGVVDSQEAMALTSQRPWQQMLTVNEARKAYFSFSQSFGFNPRLPQATQRQINQAISRHRLQRALQESRNSTSEP